MHGNDAGDFTDDSKALPLFTMGSNITFSRTEIEAYYMARVPKLIQRRSGESRGPCPVHGGEDNNFAVKLDTGEWFCHSQCQRGGDILALEAALTGQDFPKRKAEVFQLVGRAGAGRNGKAKANKDHLPHIAANSQQSEPQPYVLVTAAKVREALAHRGFQPVAEYQYSPQLRKLRFEHQSEQQEGENRYEKTFRWEHSVKGVWYSGDGGLPKPLYINSLFRDSDQVEFAVGFEGEAKADIAGELGWAAFSFKDITTEQASALLGCDVVLWPDKDESGAHQADKAARIIDEAAQACSIKLVTPPPELPPAGDIIDAVRTLCWDNARVAQFLQTAADYQPAEPAGLPKPDISEEPESEDRLTQSQLLLQFAKKAGLFHTPDLDAYACLPVGDHQEVWPVRSKSCKTLAHSGFLRSV